MYDYQLGGAQEHASRLRSSAPENYANAMQVPEKDAIGLTEKARIVALRLEEINERLCELSIRLYGNSFEFGMKLKADGAIVPTPSRSIEFELEQAMQQAESAVNLICSMMRKA